MFSNAVDPGWVPTRMVGNGAPDDLTIGFETQENLIQYLKEQSQI